MIFDFFGTCLGIPVQIKIRNHAGNRSPVAIFAAYLGRDNRKNTIDRTKKSLFKVNYDFSTKTRSNYFFNIF